MTPVPMATIQTRKASRPATKPSVPDIASSKPATRTPTNVQPSIATIAGRLRRPPTAWKRLEKAWPESPAGNASEAVSVLIGSPRSVRARFGPRVADRIFF